jgi:hypothetical protein
MPFKLTITTTKPSDSTAPWPFELRTVDLNMGHTDDHEMWADNHPGFIERSKNWTTPGYTVEKTYVFDTKENCDAFVENRITEPVQMRKIAYFKEHGFTATFEITEI